MRIIVASNKDADGESIHTNTHRQPTEYKNWYLTLDCVSHDSRGSVNHQQAYIMYISYLG